MSCYGRAYFCNGTGLKVMGINFVDFNILTLSIILGRSKKSIFCNDNLIIGHIYDYGYHKKFVNNR